MTSLFDFVLCLLFGEMLKYFVGAFYSSFEGLEELEQMIELIEVEELELMMELIEVEELEGMIELLEVELE